MINEIKCKNSYTLLSNKQIGFATGHSIGDTINVTYTSTDWKWSCNLIPVLAGDVFSLTIKGGLNPRAWGLLDKNNKLLKMAGSDATLTNTEVKVDVDGYLIINNQNESQRNPSVTGVCRCDKIQHKDGEVRKVYCNEVLDGWVKDKYIPCDRDAGEVINVNNPQPAGNNVEYLITDCQIGDKFTITLKGANSGRGWCFIDKYNHLVDKSDITITATNLVITAPCDGKVILHNQYSVQPNPSVKKLSKIWYPHGLVDIGANQSFSFTNNGSFLYTNGNIGGVVDFTSRSDARWGYYIVNVKKDDTFTLTCTGGSNARAWCFTDNQRMIMSQAEAYAACTELSLTAPRDGYLIVQNNFENIVSPSLVRTNAHTYPTVKIGTREWLGANLDETLGKIQTDEFYYNNDKFTYGKYGKLYKWATLCSASETHSAALAGILPTGWRLAKKADFEDLVALDSTCNIFRDEGYGNGSNLTNFSAVTGGIRKEAEGFMLPNDSFLWSSTGNQTTTAWRLYVKYNQAYSTIGGGDYRSTAFNVRLVRDHLPTPAYTLPRTTFTGQASDIVNTHEKLMLATGDSEGVDNWTLFINVESNTSSSAGRMWDVAFNATQTGGIDGSCLSSGTAGNAFATYKTSWDTIFTTPRKIAIRRSTSKDYIQYSLDGVTWIDTWIEVSKITATASAISRRALCFGGRADLGSSAGTGTMSATLWDTALDDVSSMFV